MNLPLILTQDADGEIRVTGHRIGLFTLACEFRNGQSPEQLAGVFPTLNVNLLRAIRNFCMENQVVVDEYVASYQAEVDRQAASAPGPGLLKVRSMMSEASTSGKSPE